MAIQVFVFLLVSFLLLTLALLWRLCWLHLQPSHSQEERRRMLKVNYHRTAHCLTEESYLERGGCLMGNLTLTEWDLNR
jgi:hypothetical protein